MRTFGIMLLVVTFIVTVRAGESLIVGGSLYDDIRWGAVTPATVTIYHQTGVATVRLENLPPEWQQRFGYDPQKAAAYLAVEQKWESDRVRRMDEEAVKQRQTPLPGRDREVSPTLGKQRIETNRLTVLTGYLGKTGEPYMEDGKRRAGTLLELARPKGKLPANPQLQMRPGLWESAGEFVFLKQYTTTDEPGTLIRVLALTAGEVRGLRAFDVAWEGRTQANEDDQKLTANERE